MTLPKSTAREPKYSHHKKSGQAYCYVYDDGRRRQRYLGKYGTPASRVAFAEILALWSADAAIPSAREVRERAAADPDAKTIAQLVVDYRTWSQSEGHKQHADSYRGQTYVMECRTQAIAELFGDMLVDDFDGACLRDVRANLIRTMRPQTKKQKREGAPRVPKLCRRSINSYVRSIVSVFRWGSTRGYCRTETYTQLSNVECLPLIHRADIREKPKKTFHDAIVSDEVLDATLAELSPTLGAMVRAHRLLGCRPAELCMMRPCDVDKSGESRPPGAPAGEAVWVYTPRTHKNAHREQERRIFIGEDVQKILSPFLLRRARTPTLAVFSPAEADAEHRKARRDAKASGSTNKARDAARATSPSRRKIADEYTDASYRQAVARACKRAGVSTWTPNQLRHTRTTEVAADYGRNAAQATAGHADPRTTETYMHHDCDSLAWKVAAESG